MRPLCGISKAGQADADVCNAALVFACSAIYAVSGCVCIVLPPGLTWLSGGRQLCSCAMLGCAWWCHPGSPAHGAEAGQAAKNDTLAMSCADHLLLTKYACVVSRAHQALPACAAEAGLAAEPDALGRLLRRRPLPGRLRVDPGARAAAGHLDPAAGVHRRKRG